MTAHGVACDEYMVGIHAGKAPCLITPCSAPVWCFHVGMCSRWRHAINLRLDNMSTPVGSHQRSQGIDSIQGCAAPDTFPIVSAVASGCEQPHAFDTKRVLCLFG